MLANPAATKDAVVAWIRDYFNAIGPNTRAVLGVSGGKDSSVAATLCACALGADRVVGVTMPNGVQPDIDDSNALIAHLGIRHLEINIGAMSDAFVTTLGEKVELTQDAIINYPPRLRMATLYCVAQCQPAGALVVNTCNRSEDYVGYSTKFGDAAGDLSPLSAFTVQEVLQLGDALGLPATLVHKAPSDGLSGMTDEDKLGFTYAMLDHYLDTGECEDAATLERIEGLHRRNLHKLQPMPAFQKRAED